MRTRSGDVSRRCGPCPCKDVEHSSGALKCPMWPVLGQNPAFLCLGVSEFGAPAASTCNIAHAPAGLGEASSQRWEDLLAC